MNASAKLSHSAFEGTFARPCVASFRVIISTLVNHTGTVRTWSQVKYYLMKNEAKEGFAAGCDSEVDRSESEMPDRRYLHAMGNLASNKKGNNTGIYDLQFVVSCIYQYNKLKIKNGNRNHRIQI